MSRKNVKGHTGAVSVGKKKIIERLKNLEEEKDALIASINSFVEKAKDAGVKLLQVENRNTFLIEYPTVSQQLQKCLDSLYVLQTTLLEDSDTENEDSGDRESDERSETPLVRNSFQNPNCPPELKSSPSVCVDDNNCRNEHLEEDTVTSNISKESPVPASHSASLQESTTVPTDHSEKDFCPLESESKPIACALTAEPVPFSFKNKIIPSFDSSKNRSYIDTHDISSQSDQSNRFFQEGPFHGEPFAASLGGLLVNKTEHSSVSSFYSAQSLVTASEKSYYSEDDSIHEIFPAENHNRHHTTEILPKQQQDELVSYLAQTFASIRLPETTNDLKNKQQNMFSMKEAASAEFKKQDILRSSSLNFQFQTPEEEKHKHSPNEFRQQDILKSSLSNSKCQLKQTESHHRLSLPDINSQEGMQSECGLPRNRSSNSDISFHAADNAEQTYYSEDEFMDISSEGTRSINCISNSVTENGKHHEHNETFLDETVVQSTEETPTLELEHNRELCEIAPPFVPIDSQVTVLIAKSTSPSDFHVFYRYHTNNEIGFFLGRSLHFDYYSPKAFQGPVVENNCCLVLSGKKDSWQRARITQVISADNVEVTHVDFGSREIIPVSSLFELDPTLSTFPALTIHCYLKGVEPLDRDWSEKTLSQFSSMMAKNAGKLKAQFYPQSEDGRNPVDMVIHGCKFPIDVAQYLITSKLAKESQQSSVPSPFCNNFETNYTTAFFKTENPSARQMQREPCSRDQTAKSTENNLDTNSSAAFSNHLNNTESSQQSQTKKVPTARDCETSSEAAFTNDLGRMETSPDRQNKRSNCQYQWNANIESCPITTDDDGRLVVMASVVINPGEFFVNVPNEYSMVLDELGEEMNDFYGSPREVPKVTADIVHIGTCWCTQYTFDKSWYRVRVIGKIEREKLYQVQYVDFGNLEQVRLENLRPMSLEFSQVPAFAVRCSLACIKPAVGTVWGEQAINRFKEMTGYEKPLTVDIIDQEKDGTLSVLLWSNVDSKDVLINSVLVQENLALSTMSPDEDLPDKECAEIEVTHNELESLALPMDMPGCAQGETTTELSDWDPMSADFNSLRNNYSVDVDDAGVAMTGYKAKDEQYVCRYYSKKGRCKEGEYCRFRHIRPSIDGITLDTVEESLSTGVLQLPAKNSAVYVQISAVFSPNHFYVVFPLGTMHAAYIREMYYSSEGDELNDLLDEMCEYYSTSTFNEDLTLAPAIGSMVAVHKEDNRWYRGRVCFVDEENVMVFYIDCGHKETVQRRNVRRLLPQYLHLPGQAVECFMDVKPKAGRVWSEKAKTYFRKLTEGKLLLAEVLCVGKSSIYVSLYSQVDKEEVHVAKALVANQLAIIEAPKKKSEFPSQPEKDTVVCIPG